MSEVDRLSNSGIFPALPIGDKRRSKEQEPGRPPPDKAAEPNKAKDKPEAHPETGRQPKSLIDEYA
ncbi:MAG: hypothetical protein ACLQJ0_21895 [Steroidobacteraceae bacterium]|jgi:hypothetical protein